MLQLRCASNPPQSLICTIGRQVFRQRGFQSPCTALIPMPRPIIVLARPHPIVQAWLPLLALQPHLPSPHSCMQAACSGQPGRMQWLVSAHHTTNVYAGCDCSDTSHVVCAYQLGEGVHLSQPKSWTCCHLRSSGLSCLGFGMGPNLQTSHPYQASQCTIVCLSKVITETASPAQQGCLHNWLQHTPMTLMPVRRHHLRRVQCSMMGLLCTRSRSVVSVLVWMRAWLHSMTSTLSFTPVSVSLC